MSLLLLCTLGFVHSVLGIIENHYGHRRNPAAQIKAVQDDVEALIDKDAKAHDEIGCWCESHLPEIHVSVENMRGDITHLTHDIAVQMSGNERLELEIKKHESELTDAERSLQMRKFIRSRDAQNFSKDVEGHKQNIDALDSAIASLKGGESPKIVLSVVQRKLVPVQFESRNSLIQPPTHVSTHELLGILKQLRDDFSEKLADAQSSETEDKENHDGLVSAMTGMIDAIKKQALTKKQRLIDGRMRGARMEEQKDNTQALLDANVDAHVAMQPLCKANDDYFQARREKTQSELIALSSAQAILAGAVMLSISQNHTATAIYEICRVLSKMQDENWGLQRVTFCDKVGAGDQQDVARSIEVLLKILKRNQESLMHKRDECGRLFQNVNKVRKSTMMQTGAVQNSKEILDDLTKKIMMQASNAQSAVADLSDAQKKLHMVLRDYMLFPAKLTPLIDDESISAKVQDKLQDMTKLAHSLAKDAEVHTNFFSRASSTISAKFLAIETSAARMVTALRSISKETATLLHTDNRVFSTVPTLVSCDYAGLAAELDMLEHYTKNLSDAARKLEFANSL